MWALCSVQQERPLCIADVSTKPLTFGRASWLYRRRDAPIRNKDVNHMSHPFQRNPKFELLARSKDFGPVHLSKVTRPSENENPREKRFGHIRDIRDAMGVDPADQGWRQPRSNFGSDRLSRVSWRSRRTNPRPKCPWLCRDIRDAKGSVLLHSARIRSLWRKQLGN